MVEDWTEDRIAEAQAICAEAGLDAEQVGDIQVWLVGVLLTHFDPYLVGSEPKPLSPARWREYVERAIADL